MLVRRRGTSRSWNNKPFYTCLPVCVSPCYESVICCPTLAFPSGLLVSPAVFGASCSRPPCTAYFPHHLCHRGFTYSPPASCAAVESLNFIDLRATKVEFAAMKRLAGMSSVAQVPKALRCECRSFCRCDCYRLPGHLAITA